MINNNSALTQELRDVCKIQGGSDKLTNQIGNIIQPVIDINPKHARIINKVLRSNAAGTLYTTPQDKDFYLIGYAISANSIAAGSNNVTISVTPKGLGVTIIAGLYLYNTVAIDAAYDNIICMFPSPILLERNSAITTAAGGTLANRNQIVFGYEVDNSNA